MSLDVNNYRENAAKYSKLQLHATGTYYLGFRDLEKLLQEHAISFVSN